MRLDEMLEWWNVIYLAPLLVSLVWITVTVISGATDGGDGADAGGHDVADGDVDHDVDLADHDIGVDQDVDVGDQDFGDVGHDADGGDAGSHDHAHLHAHGDSFATHLYWILGIGRMPITLIIGIFLLCWGAFGMLANQLFEGVFKYPAVYIWPSMGVTFVVSSILTRSIAAIVAKYMPATETYGVSRSDLVGSIAKTVYTTTETTGTVDIKDAYGTVHRMQARTEEGAEPIVSGSEVIVLDFDEQDKRYIVRISNL